MLSLGMSRQSPGGKHAAGHRREMRCEQHLRTASNCLLDLYGAPPDAADEYPEGEGGDAQEERASCCSRRILSIFARLLQPVRV